MERSHMKKHALKWHKNVFFYGYHIIFYKFARLDIETIFQKQVFGI